MTRLLILARLSKIKSFLLYPFTLFVRTTVAAFVRIVESIKTKKHAPVPKRQWLTPGFRFLKIF